MGSERDSISPETLNLNIAMDAKQPIPKKSQQIKTDKPRPHVCTVCTRAFARLEHLKRHQRSHTNEKPFQCAVCGRCFARRDLVLRHQQKLHGSLPSTTRRGMKDGEVNEHVIILPNNTDANAPLPESVSTVETQDIPNKSDIQLVSPPKTNDSVSGQSSLKIRNSQNSTFRVSLFSQNSISPRGSQSTSSTIGDSFNVIPSPIPTTTSHNTPSNISTHSNTLGSELVQEPSPQNTDSPKKNGFKFDKAFPSNDAQPSQGYRHLSFSASSSTTYANNKDSINIQRNGVFPVVPSQVEFATPQLAPSGNIGDMAPLNLDLNTFGMYPGVENANLDNGKLHTNDGNDDSFSPISNTKMQGSMQSQYYDKSALDSFQFHNPDHLHHLKGTTPLGIGMYTSDYHSVTPDHIDDLGNVGKNFIGSEDGTNLGHHEELERRRKIEGSDYVEPNSDKRAKNNVLSSDFEWMDGILNLPDMKFFPEASHQIGFTSNPFGDGTNDTNDDIPMLFKSRQLDLLHSLAFEKPEDYKLLENADIQVEFNFGKEKAGCNIFTESSRKKIIELSDISEMQFPNLHDLHNYTMLYEKEYNRYFPFVHLVTLKNSEVNGNDNIALLLAIAAIGALYNCHDNNFLLLFNLSKLHIQKYFQSEFERKSDRSKISTAVHQSLVLHFFISIFFNDPNMIDQTSKQINSLIGLFASTKINLPLESMLLPPESVIADKSKENIQSNYDYFLLAQSRIRTVCYFYLFQVFRTSLVSDRIAFSSGDIRCGTPCLNEYLWSCDSPSAWLSNIQGSTHTVLDFCNGPSIPSLITDLENQYSETRVPFTTLLILLLYIFEQVQKEQNKPYMNKSRWRLDCRPKLENLLKAWEMFYIKNGGFLAINDYNCTLLDANSDFKLILPVYYMTRLRLCVDFTGVSQRVICKDWDGMNQAADLLNTDMESIRECVEYTTKIISLWAYNVKIIKESKGTTLRTPIIFVTCMFSSYLTLSHYLFKLEDESIVLTDMDKVSWLKCYYVLQAAFNELAPLSSEHIRSKLFKEISDDMFGGEEYLRKVKALRDLVEAESDSSQVQTLISELQLSKRTLYLGIRVLADAPVWPLAIGFAEALQKRAWHLSKLN